MKLYFNLRSIPQFANLTKSEQRSRYRYYYKKLRGRWLVWLPMLVSIIGLFALLEFVTKLFDFGYVLLIAFCYLVAAGVFYNGIIYGYIASYVKKEEEKSQAQ